MSGWIRKPRRVVPAIVTAALGLVLISLAQDIPNRHRMENDLTRRSHEALTAAGLSDVEVSFTGRDGRLRVPHQTDQARALAIVRALDGVRVASATSPLERTPSVTVLVTAGHAQLTGSVPTEAARTALVNAVAGPLGAANVQDGLTVDTGLSGLDRGSVTVSGEAASPNIKTELLAALGRQTPSVVDHLNVAAAPPPPPQAIENQLADLPNITFESGSATLTAQGLASVRRAAEILKANPRVRVRIEGHTDGNGTAASNQVLSEARARTVLTTLVSLGIAADRLTSAGFGESRPKVPDTTAANQAINRRVEFVVLP